MQIYIIKHTKIHNILKVFSCAFLENRFIVFFSLCFDLNLGTNTLVKVLTLPTLLILLQFQCEVNLRLLHLHLFLSSFLDPSMLDQGSFLFLQLLLQPSQRLYKIHCFCPLYFAFYSYSYYLGDSLP
jgi:hypothetical protein